MIGMTQKTKLIDEVLYNDAIKAIEESGDMPKQARPTKDMYYLDLADVVSRRSTCLKRQYGAVIVNNDEVVSTGYNGNCRGLPNCSDLGICLRMDKEHNTGDYSDCRAVHAEQNAIISASRKEMIGGTLYLFGREGKRFITAEPCPICARMIRNAGIKKVVTITKVMEME